MFTYQDKEKLLKDKSGMIEYLKLKLDQEDWHGVADAAMDIREIVAKLEILEMNDKDKEAFDEWRKE
jgi:hypothetical protein